MPSPHANLFLASLLQTVQAQQVINYQAAQIQELHLQLHLRDNMRHAGRGPPTTKHAKRGPGTTKRAARERAELMKLGQASDVRRDDEGFARGVSEGSEALAFEDCGFARGVTGSTTDDGSFTRGVTGGSTSDDGSFTRGVTGGSATDGGITEGEEGSKRKPRAVRRHARPTKTQRELYRKFIVDVEEQLRLDPAAFDVEGLSIPEDMTHNEAAHEIVTVKARFRLERLRAELLRQPPRADAASALDL